MARLACNDLALWSLLVSCLVTMHCVVGCNPRTPLPSATAEASPVAAEKSTSHEEALARGVTFLFSQQVENGSFPSQTYGSLKQGAATTSLVLYAMSHVPERLRGPHREQLQKAFNYLRPGIAKTGCVSAPDGTLDYPTYSSALTLMAVERLMLDASDEEKQKLFDYVLNLQLTEKLGVKPTSIQYGGWDIEAEGGATGDILKGTNIAITTFCLEMLASSKEKPAAAALQRGQQWIEGCQNPDGGFFFHAWRPHPGNKALWKEDEPSEHPNSYGSPTCDGLRSLFYTGESREADRVKLAAKWIDDHPEVKLVPGFGEKAKDLGWRDGLRFYYYFTLSKSLRHLPKDVATKRAEALVALLTDEQLKSGGWQNEQARMFEDDPLIATSFALIALSEAAHFLAK